MKIIQETSEILVLQERLLGLGLLGLGTAATGFFIVMSFESPVDLFGGLCIAIAALVGTLSPTETCTLDKAKGVMTLRQQRWFSCRVKQHNVASIVDVIVEPYSMMGSQFFRVCLTFNSGQTVALTRSATTDMETQQELADRIRAFLQLNVVSVPAMVH